MNTTFDQGEVGKGDIRAPSTKRNPSEKSCPSLNFLCYFVRYQSTYKHIASIHIGNSRLKGGLKRVWMASLRLDAISIERPLQRICLVGEPETQVYESA
jgi:hypothetical protein